MTKKTIEEGSQTAKRGFKNEDVVVHKFNSWQTDKEAQEWLAIMGYTPERIEYIYAVKLHGYKTDVQVQVSIKLIDAIDCQNLQVKLVSNPSGFNQIDKRWITKYAEMWDIPNHIIELLKLFTGELNPRPHSRNQKRMFIDEFSNAEQKSLLNWFIEHQTLIVSDILKGRGEFAAEWMLVLRNTKDNKDWILRPMNYCMNFFGNGEIKITPRGSIQIGRITMQRKGGDGGRETAKMLQFKINPTELFRH